MENKIGNINNFAGALLSLNQKTTPYLGIGKSSLGRFKVWFSLREWCHQIPEGLTDKEAAQVQQAITQGFLVNGRVYLPKAVKDEKVLAFYINTMRRALTLDHASKVLFITLTRKTKDGNYTSKEIFQACLEDERIVKRRDTWIKFLEEGIKFYKGPENIVEDYSDYQASINLEPAVELLAIPVSKESVKFAKSKSKPLPSDKVLTEKQKEELLSKHLSPKLGEQV